MSCFDVGQGSNSPSSWLLPIVLWLVMISSNFVKAWIMHTVHSTQNEQNADDQTLMKYVRWDAMVNNSVQRQGNEVDDKLQSKE